MSGIGGLKAGVVAPGSSASCTSMRCGGSGSRFSASSARRPTCRREGHRACVRLARRIARRRPDRRRARDDSERAALPAGEGGPRCRQARRVREAARGQCRRVPPKLVRMADEAGVVNCTNFHNRFYAIVQDAPRARACGRGRAVWKRPRRVLAGLARWTRPTGTGASRSTARASCASSGTSARTGSTLRSS